MNKWNYALMFIFSIFIFALIYYKIEDWSFEESLYNSALVQGTVGVQDKTTLLTKRYMAIQCVITLFIGTILIKTSIIA